MVVDNLASVVSVKGLDRERELAFDALERLERRVLAAVPCRVQHGPLRFPVGGGEYPEEVVARVATPEGERVDLDVAGRDAAGHDLLAGVAGDGVLQRIVAPGGLGGTDPSEYVAVNMSLRMAAEFKSGRRPGRFRLAALELQLRRRARSHHLRNPSRLPRRTPRHLQRVQHGKPARRHAILCGARHLFTFTSHLHLNML